MNKKVLLKNKSPLFRNKLDYKGDINEKTCSSDDSQSKTDGCVKILSKEHGNE